MQVLLLTLAKFNKSSNGHCIGPFGNTPVSATVEKEPEQIGNPATRNHNEF